MTLAANLLWYTTRHGGGLTNTGAWVLVIVVAVLAPSRAAGRRK